VTKEAETQLHHWPKLTPMLAKFEPPGRLL
jgi:hypothetical protein